MYTAKGKKRGEMKGRGRVVHKNQKSYSLLRFPLSPSNSSASSPTSTFSVSDETATIVSLAGSGSELAPLTPLSPRTSPLINPPNNLNLRMPSPSMRDKDKDKYPTFLPCPLLFSFYCLPTFSISHIFHLKV